jgi:hypothetical protein
MLFLLPRKPVKMLVWSFVRLLLDVYETCIIS